MPKFARDDLPWLLASAAGITAPVSIAASQTLVGAALASLLLLRRQIRRPPLFWPLVVFFLWTLFSVALSDEPRAGWPEVKKFYVFTFLVVIHSAIRGLLRARAIVLGLAGGATLSALWGLVQFTSKYVRAEELGQPFYQSYIAQRITGFMSHWATFGGHMAMAAAILLSVLLMERPRGKWFWIALTALGVTSVALLLNFTRAMWGAAGASLLYLVWSGRPRLLAALPVLMAAGYFASPEPVQHRIRSIWAPGRLDSNEHRSVLRRTGLAMIAAHPFFGIGPHRVKAHFLEYLPPDVPRPLPADWWYEHLHNTYIHYAAERGLPAAVAFVTLLLKGLHDLLAARRRAVHPQRRFLLDAGIAVIVGVMVGGWGEVNLGDSEVLACFLVVLGCGYLAGEAGEAGEGGEGGEDGRQQGVTELSGGMPRAVPHPRG